MTALPEHRVVISGIGQSAVGRRLFRDALDLTIEAVSNAISDAGLEIKDVDGIACYPCETTDRDYAGPPLSEVQDALRLQASWRGVASSSQAQIEAIVAAILAVAAGIARHVVVFRTVTQGTGRQLGNRNALTSGVSLSQGEFEWLTPFGAVSPANYVALYAQRHFAQYGTSREQLAWVAINGRDNASQNPDAVYREPLSLQQYLAARMISSPLCLFDCDVPADGSTAFVVSASECAADSPSECISIEAMGIATGHRSLWGQWNELTDMAAFFAARQMWSRTTLRPENVDLAQLYDGFSFFVLIWLEALGFCQLGESGAFVEGGQRINRTSRLPVNLGGGQLSAGRLHGFGHVYEACRQLRGESIAGQLSPPPQVAVVTNSGGPNAGCMLLRRAQ